MRENKIAQKNEYFQFLTEEVQKLECKANITWQLENQLPKGKRIKSFTIEDLKTYLLKRITKNNIKATEAVNKEYDLIESAPDFESLTLTVEWKRSATWGANPHAELKVWSKGSFAIYKANANGCGYCKLSAVMADVFNQSLSLRKLILNSETLCYGMRDTTFASGGVGLSSLQNAFDVLGYKLKQTASGKTFDVFTA